MRIIPIVVIISVCVSACTPSVQVQTNTAPQVNYETSKWPSIGTPAKATVGEIIYTEERYLSEHAIRIDRAVNETFGIGAKVQLQEGAKLVRSVVGNHPAYCSIEPSYTEPLAASPSRSTCFFDNDADGALDEFWVVGTLESTSRQIRPIPFSSGKQRLGEDGFRKELVYQGTDQNTIRIKYREFTDSLVRPAFNQDITYTATELPISIEFRSVKITIKEIGTSYIEYTVAGGF